MFRVSRMRRCVIVCMRMHQHVCTPCVASLCARRQTLAGWTGRLANVEPGSPPGGPRPRHELDTKEVAGTLAALPFLVRVAHDAITACQCSQMSDFDMEEMRCAPLAGWAGWPRAELLWTLLWSVERGARNVTDRTAPAITAPAPPHFRLRLAHWCANVASLTACPRRATGAACRPRPR